MVVGPKKQIYLPGPGQLSKWYPVPAKWLQCSYCGRLEWYPGNTESGFTTFRLGEHMGFHYEKEMKKRWKRFLMFFGKYDFGNWETIKIES